MKNKIPKLISVGDLHLSSRPPLMRSREPDWLERQKDYLLQLENLRPTPFTPIVCPGDIFHTFRETPEFTNFCLDYLPEIYAIPGQHDMPYHRSEDLHKSIYWVMVKTGRIKPIEKNTPINTNGYSFNDVCLHGFPYGEKITPLDPNSDVNSLHVAVIHSYIWNKGNSYKDAPNSKYWKRYLKKLEGYDAALFGDNHHTILMNKTSPTIFNSGTFMRRRLDEIDHRPCVGLIYADGTIRKHYLDISNDKVYNTKKEIPETEVNLSDFLDEVEKIDPSNSGIDVEQTVMEFIQKNKVRPEVQALLLKCLEKRSR